LNSNNWILHKHKIWKEKRKCGRPHYSHRAAGKPRGAARPWTTRRGAGGAVARSGEGGGAAACSGGRRGRRRRGRARGVEAGAAKPRWHGAGAGMADVNGGGARRGSGRRRRRRRCSGTLSSRGGGSRGTDGGGTKRNKCLGEGRRREEGNIWWGAFCPGWSHHPGQKDILSRVVASPGTKGVFGRAGKIPSPRPTFSPGWIYHPGQKGPVFPRSRLMLCLFLFLLTSLLKLAFIC